MTLVSTCEDFGTLLEPVACNGNGCARNLECLICRVEDHPFSDATLLQFFRYIPTNSAFQSETSVRPQAQVILRIAGGEPQRKCG